MLSNKKSTNNTDADKENEKEIDKYENLKLFISGIIGILLILIIFLPFIYNAFWCSDTLTSKIFGNLFLYLTIIPLSFIGIGLMFYIHPGCIALLYLAYYSLICWKWCNSRWMFIIILLLYLVYFFFMLKAKDFINTFASFMDTVGIDTESIDTESVDTESIDTDNGKNNKKKNNNNNK